ncbi:MAG: hypothetical protein WC839_01855 [Candidatus Paceibacterota bacterium]
MPELTDITEIDIYKEPIYRLCDFLLQKKYSTEGRGLNRPFSFRVNELANIFEHSGNEEEEMKKIKTELYGLSTETIMTENGKQNVIEILNFETLELFLENFRNNVEVRIGCTSKNLEIYQKELRKRTEALKRKLGAVSVVAITNGGASISIGEKTMETYRRSLRLLPIAPYLILLLAGESIRLPRRLISIDSFCKKYHTGDADYKRGDPVDINFLQKILTYIRYGSGWESETLIKRKAILDSLNGLNTKSRLEENFETDIFSVENNVRWIL